jgi:hypothetical protein
MKHELESHYRKEYRSLRQQFIAKVEWVTEKAGRTVEAQVYSDLSAVGNQIERQLARLVPQWQHAMAAAARAGTDGGEGVTWPESSSSEKLAEILATSQREIIRNALSLARLGDLGPRVRSLWLTLKNAAARELVTGRMWPYDLVGHEILACTDVREPHFLANRGDNFIAEGALVRKTFVLPRDYPANAEGDVRSKMKSSPMEAAVWSGRLTAPAVLVSRRFLAESEFRACLRRTRAEP